MLDLFEQHAPVKEGYNETKAAAMIGVARQTLRNWRLGYSNANGTYPPKLTEGVEWYKLRKSRRAAVMFSHDWVMKMSELKKQLKEVGL